MRTLCQWGFLSMTTQLWKRVPCLLAPFHHLPCFGKLSEGTLHGALNALDLRRCCQEVLEGGTGRESSLSLAFKLSDQQMLPCITDQASDSGL